MTITVYSRASCSPCNSLKRYLTFKHCSFNEIDVDSAPDALEVVQKLSGFTMVPMTIIDNDGNRDIVSGFNISHLADLLK